jgi:hypothetical protein
MADYVPVHDGGQKPFTFTTSGAVTGGRLVAVSGDNTVAHAGAGSAAVVGVAAFDVASGEKVTVWPLEGCVHELEASAAITQGAGIETAANGQVRTATTSLATAAAAGILVGTALTTAAGTPLKLRVHGRR